MGSLNEKLLENVTHLGKFLDSLPIGVVIHAADSSVIYANCVGKEILGIDLIPETQLETLSTTYRLYVDGTNQFYPTEQLPPIRALRGECVTVEDIAIYRDSQMIPLSVKASPIVDSQGKITHAIVALQDISQQKAALLERNQAEQLLSEYSQKLEHLVKERTLALEQENQEHQKTEAALRLSEAQNRAILTAIPDLMFRVSQDGVYLGYVRTNAFIDLLPNVYDPVGRHMSEYLPPQVVERQLYHINQALLTGQLQVYEQQNWINGRLQYEEVRVAPCGPSEVLFMIRDITEQQAALRERNEAEAALRQSEATNRALIQAIPDLLIRMRRDGVYLSFINNNYLNILKPETGRAGTNIYDALPLDKAKERMLYVEQAFCTGKMQVYEYQLRIQGKIFDEEARLVPMSNDEILIVIRDISDRKRNEVERQQAEAALRRVEAELRQANQELERLANTDALTLVANRRCFDDRLLQEWKRLFRQRKPLSLILFDADCFKAYNDHYGHPAGDECLLRIAQLAQQIACRSSDLVARYGGEEFAVILPDTDREGAVAVAANLQTEVEALKIEHARSEVSAWVTISLGISSLIPDANCFPETLIAQADQALYQAKQQGRNRYVIYGQWIDRTG